jgi:hypothetical protein
MLIAATPWVISWKILFLFRRKQAKDFGLAQSPRTRAKREGGTP